MRLDNFAYWLQGHFELREDTEELTELQFIKIRQHINLVKGYEMMKGGPGSTGSFENLVFFKWLDKELDTLSLHTGGTLVIETKLNALFVHVDAGQNIDLSQAQVSHLNYLHNPNGKDELQRC